MASSRRRFIQKTSLTSLAALLGLNGCESTQTSRSRIGGSDLEWGDPRRPIEPIATSPYRTPAKPQPQAAPWKPATSTVRIGGVEAITRSQWTSSLPKPGQTSPMNGINRITLHHAGMGAVTITDPTWSKNHVEYIRNSHVKGRGWGDIGYHLIIDRAGRVYEGRPVTRQGAHVSRNNEHNLGILVIGNFEKQAPSRQQLDAVQKTMITLNKTLRISSKRFYTHRELKPTACPGKHLQPRIESIRSRYLA